VGVGIGAQFPQLAIRGFNAEAMTVTPLDLLGRPVQMNDDVNQPGSSPFAFLLLIGFEGRDNRQVYLCAVTEGVARSVGFAASTQGARTALLAANRAGDNGALPLFFQIGDDLCATEAFVHVTCHCILSQALSPTLSHPFSATLSQALSPKLALPHF
jgi:hypothetical protein